MGILKIEQDIKVIDKTIIEYENIIKKLNENSKKFKNDLLLEYGKILNVKLGDIFTFNENMIKISIGTHVISVDHKISPPSPIKILIVKITESSFDFLILSGVNILHLNPMICTTQKTSLYKSVYKHTEWKDIIDRHSRIEDILN